MTAAARKTGARASPAANGAQPLERPAPYDLVAEAGLLGRGLLDADGVAQVGAIAADLYGINHGHIASAIMRAQAPDVHLVAKTLDRDGLLEQVGGESELVSLIAHAPTSTVARRYAEVVRDHANRRRMLTATGDLFDTIHQGGDPQPAIADLLTLVAPLSTAPTFEDVAHALDQDGPDDPTVLTRSDGQHLLYAAAVNTISSEPSVGKTTIAGLAAVQVLTNGGTVVYLDYEDVLPRLARRLLAIDAARGDLLERFHYTRPGPLDPAGAHHLTNTIAELAADLVIIDGVAEALAAQNLDEESAADIAQWWALLPRPIATNGAAVVLLDHVTKAKEGRGRWSRGSGHKLAAVDGAAYMLDADIPFSRQHPGRLNLIIAKDRPGAIGATGDTAAIIRLNPVNDGQRLLITIDPSLFADPDGHTKSGALVTQELRDAVLQSITRLTTHSDAARRSDILDDVRGAGVTFRTAALGPCLAALWQDGQVDRHDGPKGSHLYTLPAHQPHLDEEF